MPNKPKSDYTLLSGADINALTRFDILDGSPLDNFCMIWGDLSGSETYKGLLWAIYEALNTYTEISISANSSRSVNVGATTDYRSIVVRYAAERGTKYRSGTIEILNDGTYSYANDQAQDTEDEETGTKWFSVSLVEAGSPQILFKIYTDDSDENTTYVNYKIIERIPAHG